MDSPNPQQQITFPLDPASVQILAQALSKYFAAGGSGVTSVNTQTGVVVLDTSDISDTTNKRYVTDAERTVLGNTSGTNTGDQTISDATITTTNITTNNVSTSKHGFTPILPNDATKFLNGVGTYSVPPGVGSSSAYGSGLGNVTVASGTITSPITIPHGLSVTPAFVRLTVDWVGNTPFVMHSYGVYDVAAANQNSQVWIFVTGTGAQVAAYNGFIATLIDISLTGFRFVATVDATNIYLTVSGLGSGTPIPNGSGFEYLWEANT